MSRHIGSIHDFYAWVKTRDPHERYVYSDMGNCAIARYCRERGVRYGMQWKHLEKIANYRSIWHTFFGTSQTMGGLRKAIERSGKV